MKFHYMRRKDGAIVCADFDSNEEGEWANLGYGTEFEQPYFDTRQNLTEIIEGKRNDSRSYNIPKRLKEDCAAGLVEIIEVEL